MAQNNGVADEKLVEYATKITSAFVANNSIPMQELPLLVDQVYRALGTLGDQPCSMKQKKQKPAVPIKRSITPDHLICLEDGLKFKSLKRHLRSRYGLSPEEYRQKWKLPEDYPMTAPNYAATRSALALKMGLGRKNNK